MRNVLFAVMMVLLVGGCDRQKPPEQQGEAPAVAATPTVAGIDRSRAGSAMPDVGVRNPDGETVPLMTLHEAGKPLLVNLWATWCAPCIKELPTLERLADRAGAPVVVALSQDSGEQAKVSAFLAKKGLGLEPWQDAEMAVAGALGVSILPTTVLYGRDGKEVWRFAGDLDWTGAEAGRMLSEAG